VSVEPKAKRSAPSYLNISWVQHIDVLTIAQDEIASGQREHVRGELRRTPYTRSSENSVKTNFGESPFHTHSRVNRLWRRGQEEEGPVLGWSLALLLALCPKDGDRVVLRAHYRSARGVGDATTGAGQNILHRVHDFFVLPEDYTE
jgi:hypothetical protein